MDVFLHPDQKRIVEEDFAEPVLLRGVSGSGKTVVVVHRARHLAIKYPTERILVLTLNPALAHLIAGLLDSFCTPDMRKRIDVLAVGELCRRIVSEFEPTRIVQEYDPRSEETLEDCWNECFSREDHEGTLAPIITSLASTRGIDAERYIRDEYIWIRSAFADGPVAGSQVPERRQYPQAERLGRAIPFLPDWRERILAALHRYEDYCQHGAFYDSAALSLLAHRHVDAIARRSSTALNYRAVLVDEVQDLGRVELEIVRVLACQDVNGLFLAGDYRQQVHPKLFDLRGAAIQVGPRRYFRKNYRNPRLILEAGVELMRQFGPGELAGDEAGVLNPEYSNRPGTRPLALHAQSESAEVQWVAGYVRQTRETDTVSAPICIVACGVRDDDEAELRRLKATYQAAGLEVELLNEASRLEPKSVVLATLETVKGFEFSLVLVTRCNEATMPDQQLPVEEAWRDAARLYVAMTRGRDELVFTFTGKASRFLEGIKGALRWDECVNEKVSTPAEIAREKPVPVLDAASELKVTASSPESTRLLDEYERLKAENERLRSRRIQISPKGAISVYGLGRYPVTLYAGQWKALLNEAERIREFIREQRSRLK